MNCELCEREKLTHWYFEDNLCWIADCKTCNIPMVVSKKHGGITMFEQVHLEHVAKQLFGKCRFRYENRKIKEHFHFHVEEMK